MHLFIMLDFILELLLTLIIAKCYTYSCTFRAVYYSWLLCIALSEVTAVLWEDLSLPFQARTLAAASKYRLFIFFDRHSSVLFKSPQEDVFFLFLPFCHSTAVLSSSASEESVQTTMASWVLRVGSQFCLVFVFSLFSYSVHVRVRSRRNNLVY